MKNIIGLHKVTVTYLIRVRTRYSLQVSDLAAGKHSYVLLTIYY